MLSKILHFNSPLQAHYLYWVMSSTTLKNVPPSVFVGDNAFQLTEYCMKPHGCKNMANDQYLFDYCLSHKWRVIENAFGIWVHRFRVFYVRNNLNKSYRSTFVLASVVLHNMLREKSADTYTYPGFADEMTAMVAWEGAWHEEIGSELLCPLQLAKKTTLVEMPRK